MAAAHMPVLAHQLTHLPTASAGHPNCSEGMSQAEAEDLVATALALAMARDGSSGGVVR